MRTKRARVQEPQEPVSVREAVDSFIKLSPKEKLAIVKAAGVKLVPLKPAKRGKASSVGKPGARRRGRAA